MEEKMEAEGGSEKRHFMNLLDEYMYDREHLAYTYEDVSSSYFQKGLLLLLYIGGTTAQS